MCFKKITVEDLLQTQIVFRKQFSYKLEPLYMHFQELYYKTKFSNESIKINNDANIFIPLTKNTKTNLFSFYGGPIEFFSDTDISVSDYEKIKKIFDNLNGEKFFKFEINDEKKLIEHNFDYVEKVIKEIYINLSQDLTTIKSKFSSNLRNEIKKTYENVKFEIVDKNNYEKDLIFEMMEHHTKIAKRQTRSKESWKKNEDMILNDKGFLIKVTYKNKLISYSFFFHNNYTCTYFSSVGDRDYYKIVRNTHHLSVWMAIKHAKKYCKFFEIGQNTLYDIKNLSEKEKNIEKFKSKFKGIDTKFVILNSLPDYSFYEKFVLNKK